MGRHTLALTWLARRLDVDRDQVLRVLVYHRVRIPGQAWRGDPDVLSADVEALDVQMAYLVRHYVPVTGSQVAAALHGQAPLPWHAVLVTFDDGYRDFLEAAWPVLKRHGVPAVLFVPTAFPGTQTAFWWDELHELVSGTAADEVVAFGLGRLPLRTPLDRSRAVRALNRFLKALPPDELSERLQALRRSLGPVDTSDWWVLSWDELRRLAADGLAVGSHTRTHAALPSLALERLEGEIRGADEDLRRELGGGALLFAFPYGMADPRAVPVLRELGYAAAFGLRLGRNVLGRGDPFAMFRHSVDWGDSLTRTAFSLSTGFVGLYEAGRAAKRCVTGWLVPRPSGAGGEVPRTT
ncbi:MAG: polysaccharide deacetylase family protein [Armatimonadota bacterium]|nr:polysaccharide deacetylase family protein [Armatimonadota bacterium]MDR7549002.1 polysaccharide deacetylase family protein [Armatimonadota bacterium]